MNVSPCIAALAWETPGYYPPPGFRSTGLFDLGNGDDCGFYWPIGRESEPPLFCEMYHDSAEIVPIASSFAGLIRVKGLREEEDREDVSPSVEEARALAAQYDIELIRMGSGESLENCLTADPDSPKYLSDAARAAFREGNLPQTEVYLRGVLARLPEYTDALEQMASLRRREKNESEAVKWALEAISSPLCFGDRPDKNRRWLTWLKSLPDGQFPEFADDPLWKNRHALKFDTGVKTSDDIPLFEEAVRIYLEQGQGVRAVRLRVLIGERMFGETISFQQRYGYNELRHRELLRENLIAAGLDARLPVLSAI